jgi:hypothetical protein
MSHKCENCERTCNYHHDADLLKMGPLEKFILSFCSPSEASLKMKSQLKKQEETHMIKMQKLQAETASIMQKRALTEEIAANKLAELDKKLAIKGAKPIKQHDDLGFPSLDN